MSKEESVVKFYTLCLKLKNLIRTGWTDWRVQAPRLESVAEHIYGTQMLAIAMHSEFGYDCNLTKVIMMLAVHELEEIRIGDLTYVDISREEKEIIGHKAVEEILSRLINGEQIKALIYEFDERKTPEAKFAYYCDKFECDLMSKVYEEQGFSNINDPDSGKKQRENDPFVDRLLKNGTTWAQMWLKFGQERHGYDENFIKVSNYALNNEILNEK